jgi:hypothetical protein
MWEKGAEVDVFFLKGRHSIEVVRLGILTVYSEGLKLTYTVAYINLISYFEGTYYAGIRETNQLVLFIEIFFFLSQES